MKLTRRQFLRVGGITLVVGVIPLPVKLLAADTKDTKLRADCFGYYRAYSVDDKAELCRLQIEMMCGTMIFVSWEAKGMTVEQELRRCAEPALIAMWNAIKANYGATKRDKFFKIGRAVVRNGHGSWVDSFTL